MLDCIWSSLHIPLVDQIYGIFSWKVKYMEYSVERYPYIRNEILMPTRTNHVIFQGMAYQDHHQGACDIHHVHLPHRLPWVERIECLHVIFERYLKDICTIFLKESSVDNLFLLPSSVLWSNLTVSLSLQGSCAKAFRRCREGRTGKNSWLNVPRSSKSKLRWWGTTYRSFGNGSQTRTRHN